MYHGRKDGEALYESVFGPSGRSGGGWGECQYKDPTVALLPLAALR